MRKDSLSEGIYESKGIGNIFLTIIFTWLTFDLTLSIYLCDRIVLRRGLHVVVPGPDNGYRSWIQY